MKNQPSFRVDGITATISVCFVAVFCALLSFCKLYTLYFSKPRQAESRSTNLNRGTDKGTRQVHVDRLYGGLAVLLFILLGSLWLWLPVVQATDSLTDLIQLPSTTHSYEGNGKTDGPKSIDGNFDTYQEGSYGGGDGDGGDSETSEHIFIEPHSVRLIKYRLSASFVYNGHYARDGGADYIVQYSHDGTSWTGVPGSGWSVGNCGGEQGCSRGNDSGFVSLSVNLDNVRKIRAVAHAGSSAAGGEGNFTGYARIYEIQVLGIVDPVVITSQPQDLTIPVGSPARFEVIATGGAPIAYQWFHYGTKIEGETSPYLEISKVKPGDGGSYYVKVSNEVSEDTSEEACLHVLEGPSIIEQPQSQTVSAGSLARFDVTATGTPPLSYQWYRNGGKIEGKTEGVLEISMLSENQGNYYVVVSNMVDTVQSDEAQLIVTVPEVDIEKLSDMTVFHGGAIQLIVSAPDLVKPNFTMQIIPEPAGRIELIQPPSNKAQFTYIPAGNDLQPFNVTMTATDSQGNSLKAQFMVTPYPVLPAEETFIGTNLQRPDQTCSDYVVRSDVLSDKEEDFNGQHRKTRIVTIAAKTLILQAGHPNMVFDAYNVPGGVQDVKEFQIFAERVNVREALHLKGAKITIYAKELVYGVTGSFPEAANVEHIKDDPGWLQPQTLRMILNYTSDLYLYGDGPQAREILTEYSRRVNALLYSPASAMLTEEAKLEFEQMRGEITSMLWMLDRNLDLFGHPAGWVPPLSFEVSDLLFKAEIYRTAKMLYVPYWLQHVAHSIKTKIAGMKTSQTQLFEETDGLQDNLNTIKNNLLPALQDRATKVASETTNLQVQIAHREEELRRQFEESQKAEEKKKGWQKVVGTIAGVLQSVPVMQPVLAPIGEGLNLISNIDLSTFKDPTKLPETISTIMQFGGYANEVAKADFKTLFKDFSDDFTNTLESLDPRPILEPVVRDDPDFEEFNQKVRQYVKNVTSKRTEIEQMIAKIQDRIKAVEVPDNEARDLIAQFRSEYPEFNTQIRTSDGTLNGLLDEIEKKYAEQVDLSKQIDETIQTVGQLTDTINRNILAIDALNQSISKVNGSLDPRTVTHLKDMEHRAKNRLLKYHYYLAKEYEYRFLEPYPAQLDLSNFFEELIKLAEADTDEKSSGTLTQEKFETIFTGLYLDPVAEIAKRIVDKFNEGPGQRSTRTYPLSKEELEDLNQGRPLVINFVEQQLIPQDFEDLRINNIDINIEVEQIPGQECKKEDLFRLELKHSGLSKMKRDTEAYLFQHSDDTFTWELQWECGGKVYPVKKPSLGDYSLISLLLKHEDIPVTDENLLIFSRPGLWADLTLQRLDNASLLNKFKITKVLIEVDYDYRSQKESYAVLNVFSTEHPALHELITLDKKDLAGRSHGIMPFHRTFHWFTEVTLKAPAVIGSWYFQKWIDDDGQVNSSTEWKLTLDNNKRVQAVYLNTDSDEDALPDEWEIRCFGSLAQTTDGDYDEDDLTNFREFIDGTVLPVNISISPTVYDFGSIVVANTKTQAFTITNIGSADLIIGNLSITGTNATVFIIQNDNCSGQTIAPQGARTVEVKFSPTSAGAKNATLGIPSNDPDENPVSVSLTGSGTATPQPDISISPTVYNFGNIAIGSTKIQTLTITNIGSADLIIGNLSITGTNATVFIIQNDNCSGQTIAPQGACTVEVKFSPTSAGAKNATLGIPSNDPDENPLSVPLTNTKVSSRSGGGGGGGCFITTLMRYLN